MKGSILFDMFLYKIFSIKAMSMLNSNFRCRILGKSIYLISILCHLGYVQLIFKNHFRIINKNERRSSFRDGKHNFIYKIRFQNITKIFINFPIHLKLNYIRKNYWKHNSMEEAPNAITAINLSVFAE